MSRLVLAVALLLPGLASAQVLYRMPVSDCTACAHAPLYPTAYFDLDSSSFTKDWNCGTLTYDGHKGTDIAIGGWLYMDNGSMQVVAGADGDVVYTHDGENDRCGDGSQTNGMCGNQPCTGPAGRCGNGDSNSVAIRDASGRVTTYLHMKTGTVAVHVGDHVTCGQFLGLVGSSGWSTGPHAHFEVDLGGVYLSNPDDPFASTCGAGGTATYWVDPGVYQGLPGSVCQGQATTTTSTSSTTTSTTTTSGTSGTTGTTTSGTTTSGTTSGTTGTTTTTTSGTTGTTSGTTGSGDNAQFITETIPDGTVFAPGAVVTKSWTLLNSGGTRWSASAGYKLVFVSGDQLGAPAELDFQPSEGTDPGRDKDWAVQVTMPQASRSYAQTWQMFHGGAAFGPQLYLQVIVQPATDADGDGHATTAEGGDDCNDNDPSIFPGAPEVCDGKDNNCDGQVDEGLLLHCADACGNAGVNVCENGTYSACQTTESAPEICDGLDNDCNGLTDDGAVCPTGRTCVGGECIPAAGTSGTSGSGSGSGSGSTGTSGGTAGDAAASPAGCGCSSGSDLGFAFLGLLGLVGRGRGMRLRSSTRSRGSTSPRRRG